MNSHKQRVVDLESELEETYRSITEITNSLDQERERATEQLNAELQETYRRVADLSLSLEKSKERIAEHDAKLEAAIADLESFNYSVSHDLRAPLRSINGFVEALSEDCGADIDECGKDYIRRIRAASARMEQLIGDLLEFSRSIHGVVECRSVDLSMIAREVLEELRQREPDRIVRFDVEPDLVANADPSLMRVVFQNLLGNAWKYTGKQPEAKIEVGAKYETGQEVYFVRDNGVGFDMSQADKLFRPFKRLHSSNEFEGIGVGLATVAQIIHRHGGNVWAEAAPSRGAALYFSLSPRCEERSRPGSSGPIFLTRVETERLGPQSK